MNHFGEILKTFRESKGLRLKDVAKAGISISQLSRFEKRGDGLNHIDIYADFG